MEGPRAVLNLERAYPGSIHLLRYEELSMGPEVTTGRIMKFLSLPRPDAMPSYIQTHNYGEKTTYSRNHIVRSGEKNQDVTLRNSSATPFAWMKCLSLEDILETQNECWKTIEALGYIYF